MELHDLILPFAGGLGMFIYGMQIMAQGLENAAGNRMKSLLEVLTRNKVMGVLLGAFITAVIQSSSATTVMVVGFVNAGIMNLTQAMSVIMGANIGTTITGWLVSAGEWSKVLTPNTLAPLAIIVGVALLLTGKRSMIKEIAGIAIGFGLLFIGISTMSNAVAPLKESETFRKIFVLMGGNPLLGIFAGAFVTAIIQSSSASVGILQSLAAAGLVPFQTAIYIIMGQNIGTCVTAIISGIGAKKSAKTAALIHLLFNVIGTVFFAGIAILYFSSVQPTWGYGTISQTQISIIHTIFNIGTTVLLFPLSGAIVRFAKRLSKVSEPDMQVKEIALDDRMLQTPLLALQATAAEVSLLGELVKENLKISEEALLHQKENLVKRVRENEERVDALCAEITAYAIKISALPISEAESEYVAGILQVVSDMERISDHCENFSESAVEMEKQRLTFPKEAECELRDMFYVCLEGVSCATEAFENKNTESAMQTIKYERTTDRMERELRTRNIRRVAESECSQEAGIIYVDTLIGLERVADHARNIAEFILGHH